MRMYIAQSNKKFFKFRNNNYLQARLSFYPGKKLEVNVKQSIDTGTIWEKVAGFSRAIRIDNQILVAGTTATGPDGLIGKGDPAQQMEFILDRIEQAITTLGGSLTDVVRTRIYVSDINDWEIVAKIHSEKFQHIRPVTTLVQAKLVGECLVEVEAEALVQSE